MSTRKGKCANTAKCPLARKQEVFTVNAGAEFLCPLCGLALQEVLTDGTASADAGAASGKAGSRPKFESAARFRAEQAAEERANAVPEAPEEKPKAGPGKLIAVLAAVLLLAVAGWFFRARIPFLRIAGASASMEHPNIILKLAGSNTIGNKLAPALAESWLQSLGASDVKTLPGKNAEEKLVVGLLQGEDKASGVLIAAHGSATAFTGLGEGSCEIGMASRRVKADESAKLSALGEMTSAANEHVLGLDGIAVIVNAANSSNEMSKDEVMKIFTGQTTRWPDGGAIHIYARDEQSGTWDTFKSLVLAGKPLGQGAQRFEDSNALSDAVANDKNGIGFIGLPFIRSAKAVAVSEKGASPLLPTRLTVATEDYALSRRLFLYSAGSPTNPRVHAFVEYALSKSGQDVVSANGFIAQTVSGEKQAASEDAPDEYREFTRNAQRLSLDFRFQNGEKQLDNRALEDLNRLVARMSDGQNTGKHILLFGFSDSVGNAATNQSLSEDRAHLIATALERRGLKAEAVRGFGSALPVASNDTPEGRLKNRRVEVWITD